MLNEIICGDSLEVLKTLPENSVDSIVTDPPAGIGFMGKEWDDFKTRPKNTKRQVITWMRSGVAFNTEGRDGFIQFITEVFTEAIRVLKPGGHGLVWALPRTSHWTATALENAGFEIRDCVYHIFGSGFPKSHNVALGIDKKTGYKKNRGHAIASGSKFHPTTGLARASGELLEDYKGHTPEAKQWEGWGTALKPAVECWWLIRKPLSEKTVAENVLRWGVGGLNIDGCRVEMMQEDKEQSYRKPIEKIRDGFVKTPKPEYSPSGRFPAHLVHDGSEEVLKHFPNSKGGTFPPKRGSSAFFGLGDADNRNDFVGQMGDNGSAARFFYTAKASKSERGEDNKHPTVKPIELMSYLIKLITPPKGMVLDMFVGSGSTLVAAKKTGFNFMGIEKEPEYVKIAEARVKAVNVLL